MIDFKIVLVSIYHCLILGMCALPHGTRHTVDCVRTCELLIYLLNFRLVIKLAE